MIKLVLTDLDGTFLNKNGSFDQTYYEKIKTIMDQNNIACTPTAAYIKSTVSEEDTQKVKKS